uniref:RIKEN cDNA 2310003L06 gene n=1 Tax=Peromyscus maniculatus bairdii TaxID=230844 RepID=A0A8C8T0U6_PERMB
MKILILAVTTLNFVIYFPYNGSQEIHSPRKQHFSDNPPLSNHTASNLSFTLEEENSPTEDSNSYSALLDRIAKIPGSLSEGDNLEWLQADLQNFPPSGNDAQHSIFTNWTSVDFAYAKETVDNANSNASPSSDAIQDKFAISSFPPNSQITQRRRKMPLSRESGISPRKSVFHDQYKLQESDTPDLDTDSEITQSHQHFQSIGRTEELFASDPATYMQNSMEKFTALADEGTIDTSNENTFLGTGTTTNEETEQESVFFIDSTAPIKKDVVIPRKYFGSLIDKETSNEEESTFHTEAESESEVDVFQETEDISSSHNLKHFELEDGGFERNGFPNSNTANSLSQFIIVPSTEITISGGDLIIPEEENVDTLFATNPMNRKIYLKPMATKTKINSLDVNTSIKQNAETGGSVAVPRPSNSMHKIEKIGYSRRHNIYDDVDSKPIIAVIKDPYVTWKTIKNKQLSSTMESGDISNLRNDYQTPTDFTTKKNNKLI